MMFCVKCGVANPDEAKFCLSCGHEVGASSDETVQEVEVVYAGFWARFAASTIDSIIVVFICLLIGLVFGIVGGLSGLSTESTIFTLGTYVIAYGVSVYYFSKMESGERGATYGKRALGLQVRDINGGRATWAQAFGRWAAHFLSYITLYVGFLMQVFTKRRQALHDIASQTIVIDTGEVKSATRIIVGVVLILTFVALIGILAAIAIPAYQDYTIRAKTSEAYKHAQGATSVVDLYYLRNGSIPTSLSEAGYQAAIPSYIQSIKLNPQTAVITVEFAEGPAQLAGKQFRMMPYRNEAGGITWVCSSENIKAALLPSTCR